MSTMQSEVYEALRAIDIPEDKALKAASALSRRDEDVAALRADTNLLQADVRELKHDVSVLKRDVAVLKWMMGFVLAFQAGIFAKLFIH